MLGRDFIDYDLSIMHKRQEYKDGFIDGFRLGFEEGFDMSAVLYDELYELTLNHDHQSCDCISESSNIDSII